LERMLERYMAAVAHDGDLLADVAWSEAPAFLNSDWTLAPRLAEARSYFAAAAVGPHLVVAGGQGRASQLSSTEALDLTTLRWGFEAPLSDRRVNVMGTAAAGGIFHVLGGEANHVRSALHERMRLGHGWETLAPLPEPRSDGAAVAAGDGLIFVFGGLGTGDATDTVDVYSSATDTWARRSPMPVTRRGAAAALAHDGRVYLFGGMGNNAGGVICGRTDAYDPDADAWDTIDEMPTPRAWCSAVTAPDGRIWVIGGRHPTAGVVDVVEILDPRRGWSIGPPLPRARSSHRCVLGSTDEIYVLGGEANHVGLIASVLVLKPARRSA
jgi:hypothetical protein